MPREEYCVACGVVIEPQNLVRLFVAQRPLHVATYAPFHEGCAQKLKGMIDAAVADAPRQRAEESERRAFVRPLPPEPLPPADDVEMSTVDKGW